MEGISPVMDDAQRRIKVLRHQLASCSQNANVLREPTTQLCKAHDASGPGLKSQGTPIIIGGMLLDIQVICHIKIKLYLVCVVIKACAQADHRHRSVTERKRSMGYMQASPSDGQTIQRGGSVPGAIQQRPGGVARNIGECLARLCRLDSLER